MAQFKYRLQPLLDQKLERKEQLQQALALRQRELAAEQELLEDLRNQQRRMEEKWNKSRRGILAGPAGADGNAIRMRTDYLRGLAADLEAARDAEFSQKLRVQEAEQRLAETKRELAECSRQAEVLQKHRDRLEQRFLKELERKEAAELDEAGNAIFAQRRQAR